MHLSKQFAVLLKTTDCSNQCISIIKVSNSLQGNQLLRPIHLLKIKWCVIPLGATDSLNQCLTDATSVFSTHPITLVNMQHTRCETSLHFLRCLTTSCGVRTFQKTHDTQTNRVKAANCLDQNILTRNIIKYLRRN